LNRACRVDIVAKPRPASKPSKPRDLMQKPVSQPFETILVEQQRVACDGGGGALGHPRVFLTLAANGCVECPYCSRVYKLKPGAKVGHGH
jgi:uncharacterized Zn-finger protein